MAAAATAGGEKPLKVILLGDSAVGKSKLMERFLSGEYNRTQSSTYGVSIYTYTATVEGKKVAVEFWDTAGQATFNELHSTFYDRSFGCILVFDITRKETYQHLVQWYKELQENRKGIPCVLVANKIDVDPSVTSRPFAFGEKHGMPLFFCSASTGQGIAEPFAEAVKRAVQCRANPPDDIIDDILDTL